MNPNNQIAIDDENEFEDLEYEDDQFDKDWGFEALDSSDYKISPEAEHSLYDISKDVAKQFAKETLIGAFGAYGDLAELLGGSSSSDRRSGEDERISQEFQAQERMEDPNYERSPANLYRDIVLSEGEQDFSPIGRTPSSRNLRDTNELIGGPGEAETEQGRYAANVGKQYGAQLAFGQINPAPALASGIAGQLIEETGGGPLSKAAGEIITSILAGGKGFRKLGESTKKEVQNKVKELRKLGYNDEQITLALNSAYKNSKTATGATKGAETERAFQEAGKKSEDLINDILTKDIKNYEKGSEFVHKLASQEYKKVVDAGKAIKITNPAPFKDAVDKVVGQLEKNLSKSPEAKDFIRTLKRAERKTRPPEPLTKKQIAAGKKPPKEEFVPPDAEHYINFYQDLNAAGKWLGRNKKDRLLRVVKDGIKDTFKAEGKAGQKLAEKFDKANEAVTKAYGAEKIRNTLDKVTDSNGVNFKKLSDTLTDPKKFRVFEETLGKTQADNIKKISKIGAEIKDFDKTWKGAHTALGLDVTSDALRGLGIAYFASHGNMTGAAAIIGTKFAKAGMAKLREKVLTDPTFQNLTIKSLHALKTGSPKILKSTNEAMEKYLKEEGLFEDL